MDSFKRSLRYQFMETKKFIMKFWIIVILVDIFFYILNNLATGNFIGFDLGDGSAEFNIGFSLGGSTATSNPVSVAGVNLMIIVITLLVYNYERNYESFPLSQSLGMTRRDYFTSFLTDNIVVVFIFASIQGILLKVDPKLMKLVGKEPLYDFVNFNLQRDNLLFIIFSLFILFLAFISIFNLLASLNYKFGYKIWIVLVGVNILASIFNIKPFEKILIFIGDTIATRYGVFETFLILLSVAIMYIVNYFVTINTDVKRRTL
ncbi:MAG: hypothetical protein ACTHW2_11060 [Tissierella sp.]|uniref:hypothetical protein n=1 Tax=Tissierella sp. TaxID=41274 RepID=UPI003F9E9609